MDQCTGEAHLDCCRDTRTRELHRDLGARRTGEIVRDLLSRPVARLERVDLDDPIAFMHARSLGRRIRENLADDDLSLLGLDLHPDAAIAATGVGGELLQLFRCEQLAIWIVQFLDEAARGLLEELSALESVDEPILHQTEHLVEKELAAASRARLQHEAAAHKRKQHDTGNDQLTRAGNP